MENSGYRLQNSVRFVTATSLYDGHDVSINIMRRLLQASGAEVVHLGHNRSAAEIVTAAIQEDVQGIAVSSYQGGHMEFFKYMYDMLRERQAEHIRIFGGGGGVILPDEIRELQSYGICRIFSPEDGRKMGLQGMIDFKLQACDFSTPRQLEADLAALAKAQLSSHRPADHDCRAGPDRQDSGDRPGFGQGPRAAHRCPGARHHRHRRRRQEFADR